MTYKNDSSFKNSRKGFKNSRKESAQLAHSDLEYLQSDCCEYKDL